MKKKEYLWVIITGFVIGVAALLLTRLGNPKNMGFCIACFIRDTAGALKLHSAGVVQYARPEIAGLIIGSCLMAIGTKTWKAKGGSSPATRFILGAIVMCGALMFLGCPLRMVIRLAGGDLNALFGFGGFFLGILVGVVFLKLGFSLKRNYTVTAFDGASGTVLGVGVMLVLLIVPAVLAFSEKGPGSMHAPFIASLLVSIVVGALAQKSRICMVGGLRDVVMFKDFKLLSGFGMIFVTILIGNIILGNFSGFSTYLQPVSHADELWNTIGMFIAGWGSVLLGGCPLRQLILSGEGNSDSTITVIGMLVGAALAHNMGWAGAAAAVTDDVYSKGGLSANGKIAAIVMIVVLAAISVVNLPIFSKKAQTAEK